MRREVILKLICNHRIIPTLELKPFKANMLTWFARDFSETAEGVDEILAIKFKVRLFSICVLSSNNNLFYRMKI